MSINNSSLRVKSEHYLISDRHEVILLFDCRKGIFVSGAIRTHKKGLYLRLSLVSSRLALVSFRPFIFSLSSVTACSTFLRFRSRSSKSSPCSREPGRSSCVVPTPSSLIGVEPFHFFLNSSRATRYNSSEEVR